MNFFFGIGIAVRGDLGLWSWKQTSPPSPSLSPADLCLMPNYFLFLVPHRNSGKRCFSTLSCTERVVWTLKHGGRFTNFWERWCWLFNLWRGTAAPGEACHCSDLPMSLFATTSGCVSTEHSLCVLSSIFTMPLVKLKINVNCAQSTHKRKTSDVNGICTHQSLTQQSEADICTNDHWKQVFRLLCWLIWYEI